MPRASGSAFSTTTTSSSRRTSRGCSNARRSPDRPKLVHARYASERDKAWALHFRRPAEGIAMQREGRTDEAIAFYAQVMRDCPDEPNTVYLKAQAHLQAGELWAARLAFKRAIALNMDAADYYVGLGDTCARLGHDEEARDAYASAVRFNPALDASLAERASKLDVPASVPAPKAAAGPGAVARNAVCPCGSGLRYKQCHGRVASLRESGDGDGQGSASADRAAGLHFAATGANRRARAALTRAIARDPQDVEALHAHALLAWDAGDIAAALTSAERAAALAPDDVQIADNLARIKGAHLDREHQRAALAKLPTLVGAASGRTLQAASPPGTRVHLVSPFENAHAGTELHALEVANPLAPGATVTLWATQLTCLRRSPRAASTRSRSATVAFHAMASS
jgi:tetratricopeptide (TPR) repeat protein